MADFPTYQQLALNVCPKGLKTANWRTEYPEVLLFLSSRSSPSSCCQTYSTSVLHGQSYSLALRRKPGVLTLFRAQQFISPDFVSWQFFIFLKSRFSLQQALQHLGTWAVFLQLMIGGSQRSQTLGMSPNKVDCNAAQLLFVTGSFMDFISFSYNSRALRKCLSQQSLPHLLERAGSEARHCLQHMKKLGFINVCLRLHMNWEA